MHNSPPQPSPRNKDTASHAGFFESPKNTLKEKDAAARRGLIFGAADHSPSMSRAEKMARAVRELDRKFEEQLVAKRAAALSVPYFNLYAFPLDQEAIPVLSEAQAQEARAVTFYLEGDRVKVGAVDPQAAQLKLVLEDLVKRGYTPDVYLVSESSWEKALLQYKNIKPPRPHHEEVHIGTDLPMAMRRLKALEAQGHEIAKVSPTELMNVLLTSAVAMDSSDIHLQPEAEYIQVRFRIDGVLQDIVRFHPSVYHSLISRIKILSKLKINVTLIPQDGSFSVEAQGKKYEIRVSFLPSTYGEAVVMRLLGDLIALSFEELGLRHLAYQIVEDEIKRPNGLILTTGPTGSGKTTTLYSFLKRENKPGVKIITLENPVEYRLPGIEQIQVDEKAGLTFASSLRSVLRQDPDIVMVGEIRDFDTAEVAAQAALTGHMVYSTLHTNDAAGAIPRLLNLGVKAVILAPALTCVIAQRLVRKLCPQCKQEDSVDAALRARVTHILETIPTNSGASIPKNLKFYHGLGCAACNNIGYKDRIGIFEVFAVDEPMQQLIFSGGSTVEIKTQAQKFGMMTMLQDGLLKATEGITDIAEVFRVAEE